MSLKECWLPPLAEDRHSAVAGRAPSPAAAGEGCGEGATSYLSPDDGDDEAAMSLKERWLAPARTGLPLLLASWIALAAGAEERPQRRALPLGSALLRQCEARSPATAAAGAGVKPAGSRRSRASA